MTTKLVFALFNDLRSNNVDEYLEIYGYFATVLAEW